MTKKLKYLCKKALLIGMSVICLGSSIISTISYAKAGSAYDQLGTNAALGSPILNNNFSIEDWNKWEMVCWGIFLSNFCTPLVDNYKTAFQTIGDGPSAENGSNGAGYAALCFGSGNDSNNNDVIEDLANYAVVNQMQVSTPLYVTYNEVGYDTSMGQSVVTRVDPNSCTGADYIGAATFQDLFMNQLINDSSAPMLYTNTSMTDNVLNDMTINMASSLKPTYYVGSVSSGYSSEHKINYLWGYFPSFWIKNDDGVYIKVFDYSNPWDMQIASAIVSKGLNSPDTSEIFCSNLNEYYNADSIIKFDCFGNIVTTDNKVIIPGSANQNLTTDRKINLVNSFVMNGPSENTSTDAMITGLSQYIGEGLWAIGEGMEGGVPAFSGKRTTVESGSCFVFYDLDNVILQNIDYDFGDALIELYDYSDITAKSQKYNLKLEVINILNDTDWLGTLNSVVGGDFAKNIAQNQVAASLLSTQVNEESKAKMLTEITLPDGSKTKIFGEDSSVAVAVAIKPDESGDADFNDTASDKTRNLWNFVYQSFKGRLSSTAGAALNNRTLRTALSDIASAESFGEDYIDKNGVWDAYKTYVGASGKYKAQKNEFLGDYADNESFSDDASRMCIVYPYSEVMRYVSNILGLVDGTEFSVYSTYIYITYLDWYGITNKSTLSGESESTSDLNPDLFDHAKDILNVNPEDIADVKSEKEIESELKQYSYLMLHPTAGRDYRHELTMSGMSDWIYDTYTRIVFGTSTSNGSAISSKTNSGFMYIPSYSENNLTEWFVGNYANVAAVLIMALMLATVVIGLLKSRKLIWYLGTMFMIVNTVLLMPSMGEIVPYFTSNIVENVFSSKMTFWCMSESITNATIEADAATQSRGLDGLTADEASQVLYLVKSLNVVNLDRSLMLKRDISAKTVQEVTGSYADIQSMKSTRWLLPMIMRQYSQEDGGADYVYMQLGDLFDDMSNMYWYYNPLDAQYTNSKSPTTTSGQSLTSSSSINNSIPFAEDSKKEELLMNMSSYHNDYVDLIYNDDGSSIDYQSYAYSRVAADTKSLVHLYSYVLDETHCPSRKTYFADKTFTGSKDFADYAEYYKAMDSSLLATIPNIANEFELICDTYNRTDRATMNPKYGYLWTTENQAHYFYQLVKETFDADSTVATIIGNLQGTYDVNIDGKEVRTNYILKREDSGVVRKVYNSPLFANYTDPVTGEIYPTGYVRDIMDLQNMFTNVVPYMYQMMLISGGTDGNSGVLTESVNIGTDVNPNWVEQPLKISEEYSLYEGQNKAWLFRCNWAVKLMECPDYDRPMKVYDKDGNEYTVNHPLLTEYYPENRPMIFSEAQMKAYELDESDLNLVELKCIKANNELADKWTLMINYAGTPGLTLEVLERQLALDAMLVFNKTFSPSGVFNSSYAMYPGTVDLRNISFDSVMKMLMLNVSRDTSYIYGNTMLELVETTDILTSMLLLAIAFLCAYIIPFIRNLLMAMIFYLGLFAMLRTMLASSKFKLKVTGGQLICNVLFLFFTCCYYLVFAALINITSSDEVLSISAASVSGGNPVWVLLIVLIVSCVYIFLLCWEINFCFKHYRDMGMEIFGAVITDSVNKIKDSIRSVGSDFKFRSEESKGTMKSTTGDSIGSSGSGGVKSGSSEESSGEGDGAVVAIGDLEYDGSTGTYRAKKDKGSGKDSKDDYTSSHSGGEDTADISEQITSDINDKIDAGSAIGDEEEKARESKNDDTNIDMSGF